MEDLEKLKKFERMNVLVDLGGVINTSTRIINNCTIAKYGNRIILEDEDNEDNHIDFNESLLEYIEETFSGDAFIHLNNEVVIRIIVHE